MGLGAALVITGKGLRCAGSLSEGLTATTRVWVRQCEGDRYGGFQRGLTRVKLLRCAAQVLACTRGRAPGAGCVTWLGFAQRRVAGLCVFDMFVDGQGRGVRSLSEHSVPYPYAGIWVSRRVRTQAGCFVESPSSEVNFVTRRGGGPGSGQERDPAGAHKAQLPRAFNHPQKRHHRPHAAHETRTYF